MSENPYAATTHLKSADALYGELPTELLTRWIGYLMAPLLVAFAIISLLEVVGYFMFPTFTDPYSELTEAEWNLLYLQMGFGLMCFPLQLTLCVLVCKFMYRSNANLRVRGVKGLTDTPGWACAYWFIPIANLFKPFQAMKELDMASSVPIGKPWKSQSVNGSFPAWWAFWILSGVVTNIETRIAGEVDLGIGAPIISWVGTLLSVGAGWLLVVNVRKICKKQINQAFEAQTESLEGSPFSADPGTYAVE